MNLKRFNLGAILVTFGIILLSVPEFLLEAKHGIENYGYLGGVLIFIFYAHKAYKRHLFHERDKRWEAKFDAIAKAVGAECGPQRISRNADLPNLRRFFSLSRKAINRGNQRRKKTMEKLKSRKLWVAIITAVLVALNDQLQLGFTQDSLISFVTIAVGYILGQSHVDSKRAANGGTTNAKYPTNDGPAV